MNQEEVVSIVIAKFSTKLEVTFFVVQSGLFVSGNFDGSTLACWSFVALKRFDKGLVSGCDDLVERKFDGSTEVVYS